MDAGPSRHRRCAISEVRISHDDIANLGEKLEGFGVQLTEQERVLLGAVLWLAGQALHDASPAIAATARKSGQIVVSVEGALPSIKEQFALAFTPGALAAGDGVHANINIVG